VELKVGMEEFCPPNERKSFEINRFASKCYQTQALARKLSVDAFVREHVLTIITS